MSFDDTERLIEITSALLRVSKGKFGFWTSQPLESADGNLTALLAISVPVSLGLDAIFLPSEIAECIQRSGSQTSGNYSDLGAEQKNSADTLGNGCSDEQIGRLVYATLAEFDRA